METMTAQDFRAKYATAPGKAPKGKTTANGLTKHILLYLQSKGFCVWRQNTTGIFDSREAAKRLLEYLQTPAGKRPTQKELLNILEGNYRKNQGLNGVSDIIGFHKKTGRFIAVEVKAGRDKLSFAQKIFLESVRRGGGVSIEARGVKDVAAVIDGIG